MMRPSPKAKGGDRMGNKQRMANPKKMTFEMRFFLLKEVLPIGPIILIYWHKVTTACSQSQMIKNDEL